ncbi:DUF6447 family protein [Desulfobotulus mexicanus]|uniref:Uncharacterized protein n=1 Tax=Desulfobotulus mexicanus TaxID=2586642 RepID=A0A5Q4VEC0_9BACT|nr:DUF6447 family protein [Desulfobotulus mexicanus]TYT75298.1 hypothetical protein FIM25_06235 [Desulfobotulus mexicanus]
MVAEENNQKISIDGVDYNLDDLSENAKNQLVNLRVTDQEIERVQRQLAIFQTARATYANALKQAISKN